MKKKIIITLVLVLIAIILFVVWNMYSAIPNAVLTVNYNKIEDYIISLSDGYKENKENFKTFVAIKDLKTEVKKDKVIYYAWILSESYCEKNGEVEIVTGTSMPYKFTLVDTDIIKCEYSYFGDYSIFPKDVRNQFSLVDGTGILDKEIDEQVKQYYQDKYIEDNLIEVNGINDITNTINSKSTEIHINNIY